MAEMDGKIESLRKALRAKVRMGKHEILHYVLYVEKLCMYIYFLQNMHVEICSNDVHNLSRLVWYLSGSWVFIVRNHTYQVNYCKVSKIGKHEKIYINSY